MTNFGDMINRIKVEIGEEADDYDMSVREHIVDAIAREEHENYGFNEGVRSADAQGDNYVTTASVEAYDIPAEMLTVDHVRIDIGGNEPYDLNRRTWSYINKLRVNGTNHLGPPIDWAMYGQQVYFYPIPAVSTYTLEYSGIKRGTPLISTASIGTTSNFWMTHGAQLIRHAARYTLARDVLDDDRLMIKAEQAETEARGALRRIVSRRDLTGKVQPRGLCDF